MTNHQLLTLKALTLNEVEIAEVLEYIVIMQSLTAQRADTQDQFRDLRVIERGNNASLAHETKHTRSKRLHMDAVA